MQERIQPFIVYEDSFPLDAAAEMLGCQQKKIMTEWAKGNINVVLDFGSEENMDTDVWDEYGRYHNRIWPWNIADISAPATTDFFPADFFDKDVWLYGNTYHAYGKSGFCHCHGHSVIKYQAGEGGEPGVMTVQCVLLFGHWVIPYSEFIRLHVQSRFALKPHSSHSSMAAVTATFTPGEGPRRINAPDKKNLRITESGIAVLRKLLSKRPAKPQEQADSATETTAPQEHKHVERFALGRERILAAALYVANHYKSEIGKSFKSHAECIEKYGYLFWKDEAAPDHERITKVLSDATRRPEEWRILGGNANKKK